MTNVDEFNRKECDLIDARCINGYLDYHIDKELPVVCVDSSWGGGCLDLTPIVKRAETVTHLSLTPEEEPVCLKFDREDGNSDCIPGDELSRIISMTKLKDVDQTKPPVNGDVYIYNNGKWEPFNLTEYISNTNIVIDNLNNAITNLQNQLQEVLNYWDVPENLPDDAKVAFSNINLYSDSGAQVNSEGTATSLNKNHGIYGHDLNIDKTQDELFG